MPGPEFPQDPPHVTSPTPPHAAAGDASTAGPAAAADERAQWRGLQGDVEGLAGVAAEQGRGLLDAARLQAQDYIERRKGDAAQLVHDFARSLRSSGRDMGDKPNIRAFFDGAADGLEQFGSSIERRSLGEFYNEAESFARRAPVAVAVGTFVAGLIAARFIKSSSMPPEEPRADGDARDSFRA